VRRRSHDRAAWDALTGVPLVAGPWVSSPDGKRANRHTPDGGWVCTHDVEGDQVTMHAFWSDPEPSDESYPNREAADAALRAAGWMVVD